MEEEPVMQKDVPRAALDVERSIKLWFAISFTVNDSSIIAVRVNEPYIQMHITIMFQF